MKNPPADSIGSGIPVDELGGRTVDPTANVLGLVEASNKRQDDLRNLTKELQDYKIACVKEEVIMHARHQAELRIAESARLDSIRQVDREDVAKTAASANNAITTLAKQTTDLATTLQNQVSATAAAAETRRSADMSEVNKRVSALELASSASAGKQTLADPQMDKLSALVESLARAQSQGSGKTQGINWVAALIAGAISLIAGLLAIGVTLFALLKP